MKNILIIGGSTGISAAVAQLCIDNGHTVYTACRNRPELTGVHHIPYDVLNPEASMDGLPDQIDGFVYAPGSINLRPFRALKPEAFATDFEINTMGMIRSLQNVLPKLLNSPQASIVTYSTVAVQQGMPFHASVAVAKGALEGLTRSLAAEYAPKLRVNAIAPSLTNTPLAGKLLSSEEKIEKMMYFCKVLNLTEEGDLERRKTIEKMWKEQQQIEKEMNYQQNEFSDDE